MQAPSAFSTNTSAVSSVRRDFCVSGRISNSRRDYVLMKSLQRTLLAHPCPSIDPR